MPANTVCFDLGGVLVRICPTWDEALDVSGIEPEDRRADYGRLESFDGLVQYQSGQIPLGSYLDALAEWLGGMSAEEALKVHDHVLREPYPGAESLLDEIESLGMAHGCLSNTNEAHWEEMSAGRFRVFERLKERIGSHLVGANKPDAAIYEAFEEATGSRGDEILYFDDTPVNVDAGLKREWRAHLINPMGDPIVQMRRILSEHA